MRKCSEYSSKHRSCSPRKQRCCCRDRRSESSSPCAVCCSHGRRARSCSPVKGCRPPKLSLCPPPCDPCCRQRCQKDPCESYLIKRYSRSCRGCLSPYCTDCNTYDPCSFSTSSRYPYAPRSKTDTFLSRYDFPCCPTQTYTPCCPVENDPCCPPRADRYYNSSSFFTSRLLDSCCPKNYDPCSLDTLMGMKKCDPCFPTRFDPCDPCSISKYDPCFSRKLMDPCYQRKLYDPCLSRIPEDPCLAKKVPDPCASRKYERECPKKCVPTCPDRGHPSVFKRYSTEFTVPSEPTLPTHPAPSTQRHLSPSQPQAHDPCADKKEYIPCRKITETCETIVLSKCERPKQEECVETGIITAKTVSPSCDKFNKVCYPREVPVKCDVTRHYEATASEECERREKNGVPEDVRIPACKPASPCQDICNSPEPSRQFLDKFNALGTLPRYERHMCPWEADVTVNGNVRAHCDSTAVEIAKKMTGCYRAHGERCTTDSCGQIPVECDEDDQHMNLGVLDDGTCLDFSRNNKQIRENSTNMNNRINRTPVAFDNSTSKSGSSCHCGKSKQTTRVVQARSKSSHRFQNSDNEASTPSPAKTSEKASNKTPVTFDNSTSKSGSSGHCGKSKETTRVVHARSKSSLRFRNSDNEPCTPSPAKASEKASNRYYEVVVSQDGIMTKREVDINVRRYKQDFIEVKECSAPSHDHLVSKGSVSRKSIFSSLSKLQSQLISPSVSSDDITPSYHTAKEMAHRSPQGSVDCDNLSDEVNDFLRHRKNQRHIRRRDLGHGEDPVRWSNRVKAIPQRLSPDSFKNKDFLRWHHHKCQHGRHAPNRTRHGHSQPYDDDSIRQEETSPYEIEYSRRGYQFLSTSQNICSSNRETH